MIDLSKLIQELPPEQLGMLLARMLNPDQYKPGAPAAAKYRFRSSAPGVRPTMPTGPIGDKSIQ